VPQKLTQHWLKVEFLEVSAEMLGFEVLDFSNEVPQTLIPQRVALEKVSSSVLHSFFPWESLAR
jgi:hypothetical protein